MDGPRLDPLTVDRVVDDTWRESILPALTEYIRIPALSPGFDPTWAENGHIAAAVDLIADWCRRRPITGAVVEIQEIEGRTPVIVVDIPATPTTSSDTPASAPTGTVLLYGHLDKQPEFTGWNPGLGPWTPVVDGDRLYGRGGADDGYAAFASLAAVEAVRAAGGHHQRCVVLIEASEESGSPDLAAHLEALNPRLGPIDLVICLDSFTADYDALWVTTSLRGFMGVHLRVDVLDEGIHSGQVGGVVPSSFRVLRQLIDRVEDGATGRLRLDSAHQPVPDHRRDEAQWAVAAGLDPLRGVPLTGSTEPIDHRAVEQVLATTWRPALAVTGLEGAPAPADAGNVLRPGTGAKLSLRLPPDVDPAAVLAELEEAVTTDVPYGADVSVTVLEQASGWNGPPTADWLAGALDRASRRRFGRPARYAGQGGGIPFMDMLADAYPDAQFVVTGVLGPESNAHGPNEFLHLPTARHVTACIADALHEHRSSGPTP